MQFHGTSSLAPAAIRDRLGTLPHERLTSWASVHILSASAGTLYCRVDGDRFWVSETAGMTALGLIGAGEIHALGAGSVVQLRVTLGVLPPACAPAAFFASLVLAVLALCGGGDVARAAAVCLALVLGIFWFATRSMIRWMIVEVARTIGDVQFSRAPGGATPAHMEKS